MCMGMIVCEQAWAFVSMCVCVCVCVCKQSATQQFETRSNEQTRGNQGATNEEEEVSVREGDITRWREREKGRDNAECR